MTYTKYGTRQFHYVDLIHYHGRDIYTEHVNLTETNFLLYPPDKNELKC